MKIQSVRRKIALWTLALSIAALMAASALPPVAPPVLLVSLGPTGSVFATANGNIFPLVGVQPDQSIQITVQFGTDQIAQTAQLTALDGGTLTFPPTGLTVSPEGTIAFSFVATHDPGLNQISLLVGGQEFGVQLWVLDLSDPANNPPTVAPLIQNVQGP